MVRLATRRFARVRVLYRGSVRASAARISGEENDGFSCSGFGRIHWSRLALTRPRLGDTFNRYPATARITGTINNMILAKPHSTATLRMARFTLDSFRIIPSILFDTGSTH